MIEQVAAGLAGPAVSDLAAKFFLSRHSGFLIPGFQETLERFPKQRSDIGGFASLVWINNYIYGMTQTL
jgi:hypothetical protein